MTRRLFPTSIVVSALLLVLACAPLAHAADMLVSAAASLREALQDAAQAYRAGHPGGKISFNFAASGTLASQIEQGAPVDVFVSANQEHMDRLQRQGLLLDKTRRDVAANALVIIQPKDATAIAKPQDLLSKAVNRVAIGEPGSVPAGQYAKRALSKLELWEPLQSKLVLAADVRQVREYVTRGEVEAGLVFASDMNVAPGAAPLAAKIALPLDESLYGPIRYPAAVLKNSGQAEDATAFVAFMASPAGQAILAGRGFKPLP